MCLTYLLRFQQTYKRSKMRSGSSSDRRLKHKIMYVLISCPFPIEHYILNNYSPIYNPNVNPAEADGKEG
jgi:hypothetical protein